VSPPRPEGGSRNVVSVSRLRRGWGALGLAVVLGGVRPAEAGGEGLSAWFRATRGLTDRTREVRVRGRGEAAECAVLVRRRDRGDDDVRVGLRLEVGGGSLLVGNQLRITALRGRGGHDPLTLPRGPAPPSLSLGSSPVGASWFRAGRKGGLAAGLERAAGGRPAAAVRGRWGGAEVGGALRQGEVDWAAACEGRAGRAGLRLESWHDETGSGLRLALGGAACGVLADASRADGRRATVVQGGVRIRGRLRATLAMSPRSEEPPPGSAWTLSWARTRRGARAHAELDEVADVLRLRAGTQRHVTPAILAEADVEARSGEPLREIRFGLRIASRGARGGTRIELPAGRERRGSAWWSFILPGGTRGRFSGAVQAGRAPTWEIEWGAVPLGGRAVRPSGSSP